MQIKMLLCREKDMKSVAIFRRQNPLFIKF